ncbi:7-cyano-7-deazaguanine synthase QueC [Kangiella sediminilitoris]|uniref:7-cyano-7-deazaguanine synthase n=1 Tax=Kangiella sediminilitoris TaxID=1144748 RepID=A0A1B3BBY1_9GAMM|nr:7-cyano-7-deazaguanine synthase QueC [Kangiella sediminilitoris]AOE50300.1 7-cyano-7-deazaguanine synthase [Kangiella sediminilitoris]
MNKRAVILLSGGLDSTTALAIAKEKGFECYTMSFNYGQRTVAELEAAKKVSAQHGAKKHIEVNLDMTEIGGSALTDHSIDVPVGEALEQEEDIPVTYVPARNTVFLSIALGWAEVLQANHIFVGVNAVDYSGYPDCRPEFVEAFEQMANLATKAGVNGHKMHIEAPLIDMTKAQIIKKGIELGVDYGLTVSCYNATADGRACGQCDSCILRKQGFEEQGFNDPTPYQ